MPDGQAQTDTLYRINGTIASHPLDALSVVYHRPSGQTHLMAEPVPQILDVMAQDRLTATQILDRLRRDFDLSEDDDIAQIVTARLMDLAALGIVELGEVDA